MKNKFIDYLKEEIIIAYGNEPEKSPDFARIVNVKNWNRLTAMIDDDKVILVVSLMNLTVTSPTLINEYDIDSLIMKDEIFGPYLYLNTLVMQIYIR
jgi:aldehyde dehydrogenase (NAD+)